MASMKRASTRPVVARRDGSIPAMRIRSLMAST